MRKFEARGPSALSRLLFLLLLFTGIIQLSADANLFSPPFLRRASFMKQSGNSFDGTSPKEISSVDGNSYSIMNSNIDVMDLPEGLDSLPPPVIVNKVSRTGVNVQQIPSISDINRQMSMQPQQLPLPNRRVVTTPQLRSLDGRPSQPVSRSSGGAAVNRRPTQNRRSTATARRQSRNGQKVSEGHRLITRALWRIFDALMEKNEKEELKERMSFVENALKEMISYNSKLEGIVNMIKEENLDQDDRLDELSLGMGDIKILSMKIEDFNTWKRDSFGTPQNDEVNQFVNPPTSYTSCPPHFASFSGECFLLGDEPKLTWGEARRECSKYGADLAAPKNLDSLREFLQNQPYLPEYVWVGASRQGDGDWVWSARQGGAEKVVMTPYTWNDNLPSGLGNCMGLYEGSGYRAYDYKCEELDLYVCQFFLQEH